MDEQEDMQTSQGQMEAPSPIAMDNPCSIDAAKPPPSIGVIRKLDEVVINRIAAGEVVQRPANALKELMENSLDAGAKNIQIIVKSGGLKLLQIQDDGHGIRKEDLTIVCERFTTSKLEKFEDLQQIATYGFRGEALASISHVAHVTIISKTEDSICAYKAEYTDGGLTLTDPDIPNPRACAAKQGTTIMAEDLFFNMETRRRALKAVSEEHNRIVDVITRYAVHNAKVGFTLKKHADVNNELRTPPNSTVLDNIRILFGVQIARELIPVSCEDRTCRFSMTGHVSNVNYSVKKPTSVLFINNRLVESSALKRAIDAVYSAYLPKGSHPFLYLSLQIDPKNVDVNVHPTKYEVHFLHEDMITSAVANAIEKVLLGCNHSRTFLVQSLLPGAPGPSTSTAAEVNRKRKEVSDDSETHPTYAKNMVRTDPKLQKIDKFFSSTPMPNREVPKSFQATPSRVSLDNTSFSSSISRKLPETPSAITVAEVAYNTHIPAIGSINALTTPTPRSLPTFPTNTPRSQQRSNAETPDSLPGSHIDTPGPSSSPSGSRGSITSTPKVKRREIKLLSVRHLRERIEKDSHTALLDMFRNCIFCACVDRRLSLVQHDTKLLMINMHKISVEMFYQKMLHEFGNFGRINIEEPIFIHELVIAAMQTDDSGIDEVEDSINEEATRIEQTLLSKRAMLDDYFALKFDESGRLLSIPLLLENYFPCMEGIPKYLVDLAKNVDWSTEEKCFETFCHQTALFYAVQPGGDALNEELSLNGKSWKWTIEYVVFPEIRKSFLPPKLFAEDSTVIQLAHLPDLYKIFERC